MGNHEFSENLALVEWLMLLRSTEPGSHECYTLFQETIRVTHQQLRRFLLENFRDSGTISDMFSEFPR